MVTSAQIPAGEHVPTADQRLVRYGISWSHFEAQLELRGDVSTPRMAYLEGAMELMTPSRDHERIKSFIGALIEAYALERSIELSPYGGWTLREAPRLAGIEPDECYIVGADQSPQIPDLAIEVRWTSGGLDKLEIYRRLEVGEVWFWRDDRIEVFVLDGGEYEEVGSSRLFPDLDVQLLCSMLSYPTLTAAIRAFRRTLQA